MEQHDTNKEHEKIIHVNKTQIRVIEDQLTGKQILERAGMNQTECELFLVQGHDSQPISPDQIIDIKNGLRFHAICKVVPLG